MFFCQTAAFAAGNRARHCDGEEAVRSLASVPCLTFLWCGASVRPCSRADQDRRVWRHHLALAGSYSTRGVGRLNCQARKRGNSNEKDHRERGSRFIVDVFGSHGQQPRGRRCLWNPLGAQSCSSHAGGFYSQTVGCAFPRLETIKHHARGAESCRGGA